MRVSTFVTYHGHDCRLVLLSPGFVFLNKPLQICVGNNVSADQDKVSFDDIFLVHQSQCFPS